MANMKFRSSDRTWEDWAGIALGIVIALAPWIVEETANEAAIVNAAVAGLAVMMLAELDLVSLRRWTEIAQVVFGIWVAASSLIFGYSGAGTLRVWHLIAGLLVVLLGALELRQPDDEKADR
jgi:hypothetical protein